MKEIMNVITATPIKATLSLVPVIQSNGIKKLLGLVIDILQ